MWRDAQRFGSRFSVIRVLGILSLVLCCLSVTAHAQQVTATINGTVTDPSGSVVANADVTATDLDRGTAWPTKTNSAGFYNLTYLPVGRYEVRVTASGFRTAVQSPIELQLNQVSAVNIKLVVGQNTETVVEDGVALEVEAAGEHHVNG